MVVILKEIYPIDRLGYIAKEISAVGQSRLVSLNF